jgi:AraC-like DNA-binding protein/anti-anti-sigma regulatory factor
VSADRLNLSAERLGPVCVVAVRGELVMRSVSTFTQAVEREREAIGVRPGRVVVDMSGLRFIDASGAKALDALARPVPGRCPVVVRSLRPAVWQMLHAVDPGLRLTAPGLDLPGSGLHRHETPEINDDSPTWTLVRKSRKLRSRSAQLREDSRRAAETIAVTEETIAATLLELATKRRTRTALLMALSKAARSQAARMRSEAASGIDSHATAAAGYGDAARTLRRAIAFIEERAHDDISIADIAAAAFVGVRAVQLAFRRHLGTTPLGYLRQVRLERAHRDLLAANPDRDSITAIAARWKFTSSGRFSAYYRATYDVLPSHTLRRREAHDAGRGAAADRDGRFH